MPIAFDPPTHAPHGTLPARGRRSVDEDPLTLDAFTQLLLAAASVEDAAAPAESTSQVAPPEGSTPDTPILALPLPVPVATAGAAPVPIVTIVAAEKVAGARAAAGPSALRNAVETGGSDRIATRPDAGADRPGVRTDAPVTDAPRAAAWSHALPAAPAPATPAVAGIAATSTEVSQAPSPRSAATLQSAAATLAALLAPSAGDARVAPSRPALERASAAVTPPAASAQSPLVAEPPLHVETIGAPAFTPGWQDEAVGKLAQIVLTRTERAELRLHPAELGPVSVRIEMRADQASVQIVAASPETRSALEQSLPQLRDLLASQGITLGQATVHDGTQRDPRPEQWAAASPRASGPDADPSPRAEAVAITLRRPDRLVDVFA